jgi:hypothetical protein
VHDHDLVAAPEQLLDQRAADEERAADNEYTRHGPSFAIDLRLGAPLLPE